MSKIIIDREKLIEKLENKVEKYKRQFEEINNNPQFRNIAFGSAGYLSKGSKNRLYKYREKLGTIATSIQLTNFCIRIVKGETFKLNDLHELTLFITDLNPEFEFTFYNPCFSLAKVKEVVNIIFDRYSLPYKKDIFNCGLEYENEHGTRILINLIDC